MQNIKKNYNYKRQFVNILNYFILKLYFKHIF